MLSHKLQKKVRLTPLISFFIFLFILLGAHFTYAAVQYNPLTPDFPKINLAESGTDFSSVINSGIKLVIGLTGILAVLMIVYGGIKYVSTDSWFDKDSGKKRIQAAVGGLVLALSSYLILNTIDPSLTYLNFTKGLDQVSLSGPLSVTTAGGSLTLNGQPETTAVPNTVQTAAIGERPINETPTDTPQGVEVTPSKVSLDNDGRSEPPFKDTSYQPRTSCTRNGQYLDAGTDLYVVVPLGSPIPCETRVTVINNTTGQSVQAFVGDRGPGFGEMSRATAQALSLWQPGDKDAIRTKPGGGNYNITYIFHTK